jgi:hypothetical protein
VQSVGPVAEPAGWELTPGSTTQGNFTTQTPTHTVKLNVLLNPQVPPRVQHFELTATPRPASDGSSPNTINLAQP